MLCSPGTGTCNGNTSHMCNQSGTGYDDIECDPVQGSTCDAGSGLCTGPCAPQAIGKSYIGCDYYPTITGNEVSDSFSFAVAVSNTSTQPAMVTIDGGALSTAMTFTVQPGDVNVQPLPWNDLKLCHGVGGCGGTQNKQDYLAPKGAFHLRSTEPVTVYQFSPLDYSSGGSFSYTNDASLLIPSNAWTGSYVVASYPSWTFFATGDVYPGLMTVVASHDNTHVTITAKTTTPGGPSSQVMQAGVPGNVTLNAGDALELQTYGGDFTGSLVNADKPVQVIGGHDCTFVPPTIGYCDHLEESMFPIETLSTKYVIAAPSLPASGFENGKVQIVRITGTAPGTTLTYDPPQAGAPTTIPDGGFIEVPSSANSYFVSANHKILVSQFMEGQDAGGGTGDPAMALAVATDQYRSSYLFHAPTNYEVNYVQITAPTGASVMLDGAAVAATFTPIGTSGFGVARVQLSNAGNGNHSMSGTMPFGIQVYGYGQYTSYWYPGGLNLADIPVN
ncbi:MAG TPA: IgGFc-binding protein [Kofleriaceae bacterium]|nr:IgGFc-binding protein [Kofleriaceae bacterium]